MRRVSTFAEVRELNHGSVGLVPTMGFLHEGHLSLIAAADKEHDHVVVSVFVNPLQFGDARDLDTYPRDIERDAELAGTAGGDVLFVPSLGHMYPEGAATTVDVGSVGDAMEGVHRPGHFSGVATVVAKLFAGVQPDAAYFGQKDAQQLAVVSSIATDLAFPVDVRACPVVREHDGLALSSRNVRVGADDRLAALSLFRGLSTGADAFEAGERSVDAVVAAVLAETHRAGGVDVEYVSVADARSARVADGFEGKQFLAIAAQVGGVRLIDNVSIDVPRGIVDRGTRLTSRSILYERP